MAMGFLLRLREATQDALGISVRAGECQIELEKWNRGPPALLSRLASANADLVNANTSWRPNTRRLRIEIMASGPFESLRGISTAVNRLQNDFVTAIRQGTLELRLTEVRRTCRHSTPWSTTPTDPGASSTKWECQIDSFVDAELYRTLFAQAFRDSVRNDVNHVIMLGDRYDDGFLSLNAAIRDFRRRGIRVSTFYLGNDFNGRNMYRFLATSTGGLFLPLSVQSRLDAVLPIVAAFACGDHAGLAALPSATPEAKALIAQICRR
jgi:hypothetical protein